MLRGQSPSALLETQGEVRSLASADASKLIGTPEMSARGAAALPIQFPDGERSGRKKRVFAQPGAGRRYSRSASNNGGVKIAIP